MERMSKSGMMEIFGRAPLTKVTVSLPITLRSPDGLCQVVVDDEQKPSVVSTWAHVWFAVELVTARCVRAGTGGSQAVKALDGTISTLRVTVEDEADQLVLPGQGNGSEE
ncbi:MAG: hypothetical protein Q9193_006948 [Seirophora villosa]